jgi:Mor family transcriptional regulator
MTRRLLDYDPLTKESVYVDYLGDGVVELYHEQDCSQIIEQNKSRQADKTKFARQMRKKGGDVWHYASVPNIVIMEWKKKLNVDLFNRNDEKKVLQLLNSPDYKWLRTSDKKHAV